MASKWLAAWSSSSPQEPRLRCGGAEEPAGPSRPPARLPVAQVAGVRGSEPGLLGEARGSEAASRASTGLRARRPAPWEPRAVGWVMLSDLVARIPSPSRMASRISVHSSYVSFMSH